MSISKIFVDPTKGQAKFQILFQVGTDQFELYGLPSLMSLKSELMESLLDTLNPSEVNILAPNMKVNKESLYFLWERMNFLCNSSWTNLKSDTMIGLWPLLNYFNINVKDNIVTGYISELTKNFPKELILPENKDILNDMLKKIEIIDKESHSKLITESIKASASKVSYYGSYGRGSTVLYNPDFPEKIFLGNNYVWTLETDPDTKRMFYLWKDPAGGHITNRYYTFPEWDENKKSYVMYETDKDGRMIREMWSAEDKGYMIYEIDKDGRIIKKLRYA